MGITRRSLISRPMRRTKDIRRLGRPLRPALIIFFVTVAEFCLLFPEGEPIGVNYTTQPAVQERQNVFAAKKWMENTALHSL
jgi:hypothetical protein